MIVRLFRYKPYITLMEFYRTCVKGERRARSHRASSLWHETHEPRTGLQLRAEAKEAYAEHMRRYAHRPYHKATGGMTTDPSKAYVMGPRQKAPRGRAARSGDPVMVEI